jgi:hypothetical protein
MNLLDVLFSMLNVVGGIVIPRCPMNVSNVVANFKNF